MGVLVSLVSASTLAGVGCKQGESCEITPLPLQATQRFAAGATYYLPGLSDCADAWSLAEAPEANRNAIVAGADGYTRFTPVVPGRYVFRAGEIEHTLSVVETTPFEHFNYYPTSSVAAVGDELWVAHVFDPHISRIDPTTHELLGSVRTGPWPVALAWREGMDFALVVNKGGDTLGLIDLASQTEIDAIWVGDEPTEVVIAPDGKRAYVSLATQNAIAVVDLEARALLTTLPTNPNPMALALTDDGQTLFVASYRSATSERLDGTVDDRGDLYDIAVVDTATLEVADYIEAVGSNINGLLVDGDRLLVATTRMVPGEFTIDENNTAFRHTIASYDLTSLSEITSVDLGRQASSTGFAVRPFGMARLGERLWVATEGSDAIVGLDPTSLAELARVEVLGRPRSLLALGEQLYVHGVQRYEVAVLDANGSPLDTLALAGDPRPEGVAAGQYRYTGHGADGGDNHGCGECHTDGLTDGNLWNAGVFSFLAASRPMFWLEGTHPIGWEADGADLYSYLFGSPAPTIGVTIDTEDHAAFYDYLAALVPPPPANGSTERDGSMSELALRGQAVFRGAGACSGCHAGPLTTNRIRYPAGTKPEPTDVPSLIGSYRHGYWLIDGSARTLDEAVAAMLPLSGASLSDTERSELVGYLQELGAREFFLLGATPEPGASAIASSEPIRLTFSHPIFDDPANLERIQLRAGAGEPVAATISVAHRHVLVQPASPLDQGQAYELVIAAGFEAFDERATEAEQVLSFTVAAAPALTLAGDYVMTILRPGLDFANQTYDFDVIIPIETPLVAETTDYGARVVASLSGQLEAEYEVVVEGTRSRWPALIMATSPKLFGKTFPTEAELVDEDQDGIADAGSGTLFFRSPGLEAEGVAWTLSRPTPPDPECATMSGTHPLTISYDLDNQPIVAWDVDLDALGYYVTDPDAIPPVGPGTVTGGVSYWVVQTVAFPAGFRGPIDYGVVPDGAMDATEANGGPLGGAALPASGCIKLTVQFADFSTSVVTYVP